MEVVHHTHSSDKIDKVPTSTVEEVALGHAIVEEEFDGAFWLTTGLSRHVGVKGDDRLYGETVLVETDDRELARETYRDTENLARVSTRITNAMSAVVKVLYDPFGNGTRPTTQADGAEEPKLLYTEISPFDDKKNISLVTGKKFQR